MRVRIPLLPPINKQLIQINMDKFLSTECIGEFFSKMYEANKGKGIEVWLKMEEGTIQIYNKEKHTDAFQYVRVVTESQDIDSLVNSLSK